MTLLLQSYCDYMCMAKRSKDEEHWFQNQHDLQATTSKNDENGSDGKCDSAAWILAPPLDPCTTNTY